MWLAALILYNLPFVARVGLAASDGQTIEWWRVAVSFVPLVIVFPSTLLPRWVEDENREHVWRHAVYALAFSASVGTSVRWTVIADALQRDGDDDQWATSLVLYLIIGTVTLWWFCVSHIFENTNNFQTVYTHQGDVAVLPLTLVAISTFVESVPDEAFQFSRSVIFFVPVVVAWATLHFVAYSGFAISTVTTHSSDHFDFLALGGLVIASAQLCLIEMRAPSSFFQFFPLVAAMLCQMTRRPHQQPRLRAGREWGVVVAALGLGGGGLGAVLATRFETGSAHAVAATAAIAGSLTVPYLAGRRWVFPATLYTALLTSAYLHAVSEQTVRAVDVLVLLAGFCATFWLLSHLAPAVAGARDPPQSKPSTSTQHTPQDRMLWWSSPSKLMRPLRAVPCGSGCAYDEDGAFLARFYERPISASCPREFVGVWWMCGNRFPMHLTCVHHNTWRDNDEGQKTTTLWMREDTTRSATLSGMLLWLGQVLCMVKVTVVSRWIRTEGYVLPALRFFPDTYWLYRVSDDEMLRLVYDKKKRVVWQYRMLRISRHTSRDRTIHYPAFMRAHQGDTFWYG